MVKCPGCYIIHADLNRHAHTHNRVSLSRPGHIQPQPSTSFPTHPKPKPANNSHNAVPRHAPFPSHLTLLCTVFRFYLTFLARRCPWKYEARDTLAGSHPCACHPSTNLPLLTLHRAAAVNHQLSGRPSKTRRRVDGYACHHTVHKSTCRPSALVGSAHVPSLLASKQSRTQSTNATYTTSFQHPTSNIYTSLCLFDYYFAATAASASARLSLYLFI